MQQITGISYALLELFLTNIIHLQNLRTQPRLSDCLQIVPLYRSESQIIKNLSRTATLDVVDAKAKIDFF